MFQFPLTVDQVTQFRGELTSHGALRAAATVGLQRPVVWELNIGDDGERWKLRTRAGGENDDNLSYIVPVDYDASTNNVIWVRVE